MRWQRTGGLANEFGTALARWSVLTSNVATEQFRSARSSGGRSVVARRAFSGLGGFLWVASCLMACAVDAAVGPTGVEGLPPVNPPSASVVPPSATPSPPLGGGVPVEATPNDAGRAEVDGGSQRGPDTSVGLLAGSLEVRWMHGAARCDQSTDAELQVHAYNSTTYILRQDKCRTFEAPFIYLLLGLERALLLDTGATASAALRDTIAPLVGGRDLVVAHTHAHGDHTASDERFIGLPSTSVIGTTLAQVRAAFGFDPWPTDVAELDLGERLLDVLAVPGHEQTHIALYDRQTGLLFTGDTLYPGLLFINDWTAYRASVRRLAEFVEAHAVSHVLGAHVEMTSTPAVNYPYGTTFQPDEHVLELEPAHVIELDAALTALGASPPPRSVAHDDFVIEPQ
jgi:hydroxyacylglutathione hydrolase